MNISQIVLYIPPTLKYEAYTFYLLRVFIVMIRIVVVLMGLWITVAYSSKHFSC